MPISPPLPMTPWGARQPSTSFLSYFSFAYHYKAWQLEDMAIAAKTDSFKKGEVILLQGEMCDRFCIVKEGTVCTSRRGFKPKLIEERRVFGSTSLTEGIVSQYTCTAATDVTIYFLTKDDFELILGYIPGPNTAMPDDRSKGDRMTVRLESMAYTYTSISKIYDLRLNQLSVHKLLGEGAFGQVRLVQSNQHRIFCSQGALQGQDHSAESARPRHRRV